MKVVLIQTEASQLLRLRPYDNALERRRQNTEYHEWQGSNQYFKSDSIFFPQSARNDGA